MTGYNTVPGQTDDTPCIGASGANICGRTDAVACPRHIALGTRVEIRGESYICEDRLAKKFDRRFDISCDRDTTCPPQVTGWVVVRVFPGDRVPRPIPAQLPPQIYAVTAEADYTGTTPKDPESVTDAITSVAMRLWGAAVSLADAALAKAADSAVENTTAGAGNAADADATKAKDGDRAANPAPANRPRFRAARMSPPRLRIPAAATRFAAARGMTAKPVRAIAILRGRARSSRIA